jgi:hypothetical protein
MKTLACLLLMTAGAFAAPGFRAARVYVGGGYGYHGPAYWGSGWYPAYGYGWYPGWTIGPSYHRGLGEVKLSTETREAEVFVDGSYAGIAKDLKSIWLRPGSYDIEVRAPGRASYYKRVYVIAGKTVRIDTREGRP